MRILMIKNASVSRPKPKTYKSGTQYDFPDGDKQAKLLLRRGFAKLISGSTVSDDAVKRVVPKAKPVIESTPFTDRASKINYLKSKGRPVPTAQSDMPMNDVKAKIDYIKNIGKEVERAIAAEVAEAEKTKKEEEAKALKKFGSKKPKKAKIKVKNKKTGKVRLITVKTFEKNKNKYEAVS